MSSRSSRSSTWRAVVAAAGAAASIAAAGFLLLRHMSAPRVAPFSLAARKRAATTRQQAFVLAVNLRFQQERHKQQFLEIWQPLAAHVRAHEPATLAFELLASDSNPLHIMVFERYLDRAAYADIHRSSHAFQRFKAAQTALPFKIEVQGNSFIEQNLGFML